MGSVLRCAALALVLVLAWERNSHATSPSSDGSATGEFHATTSGTTGGLTTTTTNDIVVVVVFAENTTGSSPTINTPTSTHLTFAQRGTTLQATVPQSGGGGSCIASLAVFTAVAASALTSEVISASTGASVDGASINALGVKGVASTASPWDPNASLPKNTSINTSGNQNTTAISTTNADDLIIGALGYCANPAAFPPFQLPSTTSPTSTLSSQVNHREGSGTNWAWAGLDGNGYASTQSGITPGILASAGLPGFLAITDALTADAPPATGHGGLLLLGVGN